MDATSPQLRLGQWALGLTAKGYPVEGAITGIWFSQMPNDLPRERERIILYCPRTGRLTLFLHDQVQPAFEDAKWHTADSIEGYGRNDSYAKAHGTDSIIILPVAKNKDWYIIPKRDARRLFKTPKPIDEDWNTLTQTLFETRRKRSH
jgi:hypothetical protein